jgi:hypothetical protein
MVFSNGMGMARGVNDTIGFTYLGRYISQSCAAARKVSCQGGMHYYSILPTNYWVSKLVTQPKILTHARPNIRLDHKHVCYYSNLGFLDRKLISSFINTYRNLIAPF